MVVIRLFWKWLEKENLEAENVSYVDLLLYMKYRSRKGTGQLSIQNYMSAIKHFFEHLIGEGKISKNPTSEIEVKGVK